MVTPRLFLAALCVLLGLTSTLSGCSGDPPEPSVAEGPAPEAIHVRLEGEMGIVNMALLERGLRTARAGGQRSIIVEIDTPGGRVDHAIEISRQLEQAREDGLRTVAWINSSATSAGALVTLACERIYMDSSATIGAALPVVPSPGGISSLDGDVGEKFRSYLRSEFRAQAEANGRSKLLAEAMVDPALEVREVRIDGVVQQISGQEWDDYSASGSQPELLRTLVRSGELLSLTTSEAIAVNIADGVGDSLDEVLEREGMMAGRAVSLQRSRSENLLAKLSLIEPALLAIGLLLGYIELKTPGFGIAGILGLCCLGLYLSGRYMVGLADEWHLVMVFVGAVLIAVELFLMPGTLWFGLGGAISIMAGLWLSEFGPGFSFGNAYDQSRALDAAFELGLVALASMVGIWILSYFLPDTPILRALVQAPSAEGTAGFGGGLPAGARAAVGDVGVAVTDLRPVGKVKLDTTGDEEFEARADGNAIEHGARVRVLEVHPGRLVVETDTKEENA